MAIIQNQVKNVLICEMSQILQMSFMM